MDPMTLARYDGEDDVHVTLSNGKVFKGRVSTDGIDFSILTRAIHHWELWRVKVDPKAITSIARQEGTAT